MMATVISIVLTQIVDIISLADTGTAQAQTARGPNIFQDVPVQPIVVLSVTRLAP